MAKANRRRRIRDEEGGTLLLLAGIILVLSFLITSVSLSAINDLEKQAAAEQDDAIIVEFRFIREKIGTTLWEAVTPTTNNATFKELLNATASPMMLAAHEKGYDLEILLAGERQGLSKSEWSFTRGGWPANTTNAAPRLETAPGNRTVAYHFHAHNLTVNLVEPQGGTKVLWDNRNDGVVWTMDCLASPGTECIQAAIIYLRVANQLVSIEEFIAYPFNKAP